MVYKLISKIITARLAAVIGEVIDDAQAGFIQGNHIGDNILLATELIKGYDHKISSPRCMVKVYLKKPMTQLNGAKKGLRQGDLMSPFLFAIGMEYLSRCLYELRLTPDFNFHPICEKLSLTHMMFADDLLMFSRAYGSIPFRYLGVPLSSKKLTVAQCSPLVEKVTAQIFILTKKILKEIEARFRCFLWTGSSAPARKSLVAWKYVCLPKVYGGWNLLSLPEWNKAAVTKLLWDIAHKADNLWVKWVHIYYFKHRDYWNAPIPAKCSWFLKKILSCRDILNNQGGWDGLMQAIE
ncbi:uncharacterized protein LOC110698412 [Chenopodium quinoa]|uniref:uncharacterized protein LOC110698412 n=1 Tax=Chenopodium quinoa TaxID=63459 RepID=UPI000B77180D|nr:uncharacterized protein LOC110698412 [Chenopodium quinoa]